MTIAEDQLTLRATSGFGRSIGWSGSAPFSPGEPELGLRPRLAVRRRDLIVTAGFL
jgi:hypothetical protein